MQAVSERRLHHGDLWLKKRDYENARQSYATAIDVAPDTPLPHFRMGMVLSVLGRFPDAVAEFKKGLEFDPTWPATSESLNDLFGATNRADISSMENRAADWVQHDIRDPDRLFLMGVLLHFDKHSQAGVFFETAMKLAGSGAHLEAFLQPPPPDGLAAVAPKDTPIPPQPAGTSASDAPAADSKASSTNRSPAFVPPLPAPENEPDRPSESTVPNTPPVKQPEDQGQDSGPVLLPPNS